MITIGVRKDSKFSNFLYLFERSPDTRAHTACLWSYDALFGMSFFV